MGFWGTLIVCPDSVPLPQVPEVRALDQDVRRWAGSWRTGWQGWRIRGETPGDLPETLGGAGLVPMLSAEVMASDAAYVTGFGPAGGRWAAWLQFEAALGHYVPPPAPFDDEGEFIEADIDDPEAFPDYHRQLAETRQRLLTHAPGGRRAAEAAVAWARDCGLALPSTEAVHAVLTGREVFVEALVDDLVRLVGLVDGG
ncbi:hypothetical protein AB0J85_01655 [Micromonospora echinofusca]|uniref:hypothetical protein n=1 Tax=Micromonospora echinofusca TaxID=47858 RepID=UPI00342C8827